MSGGHGIKIKYLKLKSGSFMLNNHSRWQQHLQAEEHQWFGDGCRGPYWILNRYDLTVPRLFSTIKEEWHVRNLSLRIVVLALTPFFVQAQKGLCVCVMCDVFLQFTQILVLHSIFTLLADSISSHALFSSKSPGERIQYPFQNPFQDILQ